MITGILLAILIGLVGGYIGGLRDFPMWLTIIACVCLALAVSTITNFLGLP